MRIRIRIRIRAGSSQLNAQRLRKCAPETNRVTRPTLSQILSTLLRPVGPCLISAYVLAADELLALGNAPADEQAQIDPEQKLSGKDKDIMTQEDLRKYALEVSLSAKHRKRTAACAPSHPSAELAAGLSSSIAAGLSSRLAAELSSRLGAGIRCDNLRFGLLHFIYSLHNLN